MIDFGTLFSGQITEDQTYSYAYTNDGKLSAVSESRGRTTFTYDGMDGLTKVAYPDGRNVEYI